MKKTLYLLPIVIFISLFTHKSNTEELFLKKRSGRISESSTDLKHTIGNHYKKDLTNSAHLIASLSERVEILAKKANKLLNNDALFSGPHAATYEKHLEQQTQKLATIVKQVEQLNKELDKDFELS